MKDKKRILVALCMLFFVILVFTGCGETKTSQGELAPTLENSPSPEVKYSKEFLELHERNIMYIGSPPSYVPKKEAVKYPDASRFAMIKKGVIGYKDLECTVPAFTAREDCYCLVRQKNDEVYSREYWDGSEMWMGREGCYYKAEDIIFATPEEYIDFALDYDVKFAKYEGAESYILEVMYYDAYFNSDFFLVISGDGEVIGYINPVEENKFRRTRYWFWGDLNFDGAFDFIVLSCDRVYGTPEEPEYSKGVVVRREVLEQPTAIYKREDFVNNFQNKEDKSVVTYLSDIRQGGIFYSELVTPESELEKDDYIPINHEIKKFLLGQFSYLF